MSKLKNNGTSLKDILAVVNSLPEHKEYISQEKTVTPTTQAQTITPDSGYDGLSKVTVRAIPENYEDRTAPLAELNTANGGTAASTMAAAVDNTEAKVSTQSSLITQIADMLAAKFA